MKRLTLLLALFAASCSGLGALNAITPGSGYTRTENLAYGPAKHQSLDVYQPTHPLPTHPVVLFVYGGSWQTGDKSQYRFVGQALASRGITTVVTDYRLAPQVAYPAFLNDTASALVWTHNHIATYGGNPANLFIAGHSAGAYNAIMVATNNVYLKQAGGNPAWLRGAIGLAGPYNFLPLTDPELIRIFGGANRPATQPITYVKPNLPPMLLLAGNADTTVAPSNTISMAKKLTEAGNTVTTRYYPGITHASIMLSVADHFQSKAPTVTDIVAFIAAHSTSATTPR